MKITAITVAKLDRLSVVVFAFLVLWLCWKLASLFWWVIAPPQMMQFDRVELGSQQPQIPNISTFRFLMNLQPMQLRKMST